MLMMEVPAEAVMVGAVTIDPAVQVIPVSPLGVLINKPDGSVSEKPTPARLKALGLVKVNRSVEALPCAMGSVAKAFDSVGGSGRGQPEMVILSSNIEDLAWLPRVTALMRNQVSLTPVATAFAVTSGCQEPLVAAVEPARLKFVPSVLEYT